MDFAIPPYPPPQPPAYETSSQLDAAGLVGLLKRIAFVSFLVLTIWFFNKYIFSRLMRRYKIQRSMPPVVVDDISDELCVICYEELKRGELCRVCRRCGQKFHVPCIDAWLIPQNSCPTCRNPGDAACSTLLEIILSEK